MIGDTYEKMQELRYQLGQLKREEEMIRNVRQSVVSGKDNEVTTIINGRVVEDGTFTSRNSVSIPGLADRLIALKNIRAREESYKKELDKLGRYLGAFDLGVMWYDTNETFVVYALDAIKD